MDFRRLNVISKPLVVPLPLTDDMLSLLGKAKYFSTIDLRSGYWQVAFDEADREKAACQLGLFQFRNMPFSLKLLKCQFLREETKYLEFIINGKGIK